MLDIDGRSSLQGKCEHLVVKKTLKPSNFVRKVESLRSMASNLKVFFSRTFSIFV